ncbi:MAG: hypothetical protein AAFQ05_12980, partial [Pseudomonadota bacterium]
MGGIEEAASLLPELLNGKDADFIECSERDGKIAGLHRFAAAGAA